MSLGSHDWIISFILSFCSSNVFWFFFTLFVSSSIDLDTSFHCWSSSLKSLLTCALTAADKAFSKSRISFLVFLKFACSWSFIFPKSSWPLICNWIFWSIFFCPFLIFSALIWYPSLISIKSCCLLWVLAIHRGHKSSSHMLQYKQDFCPVCTPHF